MERPRNNHDEGVIKYRRWSLPFLAVAPGPALRLQLANDNVDLNGDV